MIQISTSGGDLIALCIITVVVYYAINLYTTRIRNNNIGNIDSNADQNKFE